MTKICLSFLDSGTDLTRISEICGIVESFYNPNLGTQFYQIFVVLTAFEKDKNYSFVKTTSSAPQQFIYANATSQRLDNFLLGTLKGLPKSRVYSMIRKGEVRVNSGRKAANYRLVLGDRVRVPPLFLSQSESVRIPQNLQDVVWNSVLYETDAYLVLNKPPGMAVHSGSGVRFGLIDVLNAKTNATHQSDFYLCHRLDKDTSGVLLIAKNREIMLARHSDFRANHVKKNYVAIVSGRWPSRIREIDAPLKRVLLPSGERQVRISEEGQASLTVCNVVKSNELYSVMEFQPTTGRTHQIRVHAHSVGHPILGDLKYGDRSNARSVSRLMLHAQSLVLPDGNEYAAPIPEEFLSIFE